MMFKSVRAMFPYTLVNFARQMVLRLHLRLFDMQRFWFTKETRWYEDMKAGRIDNFAGFGERSFWEKRNDSRYWSVYTTDSPLRDYYVEQLGQVAKRTILFATWPLDHLFNLQGPSKWAYYRIFILKKS